ncbi:MULTISPECIES: ketopantoate reductase family protein [Brevibacillus]|uniref:2-dehydropantoate 2-reductase n=1 Tax=Brevibacillus borstelensis AK1 TaxID=1300222 RepID=M8DM17_9BACL|nr:2-dehydropantoate 2-reductase [Brevibacillus borstelensis]EMT54512.1 2-dehydropantoate 2-reductase [Brevibacillus borstelensis AK1]KKX54385.1 2-dehydropantoate 2-reductase [Brevibacillus borstelensis cifa_chp40]MBE5395910.1 2-dehydropantoate 2-reductase [Brevibacillus borstelensis]MED1745870.1 2-dehydropantoate 2-reductase [Brevibacillus borstelensis]MED1873172.1 2-dehydropantoate 2-reductase [Brevibacillus borstelensis]
MQLQSIPLHLVVIGGGSVGLLYASRLLLSGQSVTLVTRTREQAQLLTQAGVTLRQLDGTMQKASIRSNPMEDGLPQGDLYLLAVKQSDLDAILPDLRHLSAASRVLALQNGMGHYEKLTQVLESRQCFFASNTEGARRLSPVEVEHTGTGLLRIGPWTEQDERDPICNAFVELANRCGFQAVYEDTIKPFAWRKLLANALINPLTALFEMPNGMLLESPHTVTFMKELFWEAAAVAERCGEKIEERDWQEVVKICRNTSRNISSMLQDIRRRNHTEVNAINGYLVQKGRETGIPVPMHETLLRAVLLKTDMVKGKGEAAIDLFG